MASEAPDTIRCYACGAEMPEGSKRFRVSDYTQYVCTNVKRRAVPVMVLTLVRVYCEREARKYPPSNVHMESVSDAEYDEIVKGLK